MNRQSRLARFADLFKKDRTAGRPENTRVRLEPLEDRKMLSATPLINEIYFDPPGSGGDLFQEYIELRGEPSASLDNTYLIFLESEYPGNNPGLVERYFDLTGQSFGSNGLLTLRQKTNPYTVAPGTTDLVNAGSGTGWGSGGTSSLLTEAEAGSEDKLENSGWTAMLIHNSGSPSSAPFIGQDLDGLTVTVGGTIEADDKFTIQIGASSETVIAGSTDPASVADTIVAALNASVQPEFAAITWAATSGGTFIGTPSTPGVQVVLTLSTTESDDGVADGQTFEQDGLPEDGSLDFPTGHADWTILDSIGIFSEAGEAENGRLYAPINFGADDITDPSQINGGSGTYVPLYYEIEYVARYGNSTGQTASDWLISNLTDKLVAGFTNSGDFRQSDSTDSPFGAPDENNQGVPYGTNLTYSLGAANYPAAAPGTVDLNGFGVPHPGTGFSSTWNNSGAISITDTLNARVLNDDANFTSLTATISGGPHAGDVLSATTSGGITASYDSGNGVLTLSGTDTQANYQTVLRTLKYNNTSGGPGAATVLVDVVATDASSSSTAAVATITNNVPNLPPAVDLDGAGGNLNFTSSWSNLGATAITDSDATVTDSPGTLVSMTATLTALNTGDVLTATTSGGITTSYDGGTGVLTLSGMASAAAYETVLRTIKYNNTSGGPGVATKTINVVGNDGVFSSTTAVATVNVTSPFVDLNGAPAGTNRTVTWTGAAVVIADAAAALVTDTGTLTSLTATITAANSGGSLDATTSGGITKSYNGGTRTLTLSGTASAAAYQTVLRTIKYNNTGTGPNLTSFTVDFVANDGTSASNTATGTVVVDVNPVVDLNGGMTNINYGGLPNPFIPFTWSNLGAVNITDPAVALVQARQTGTLAGMTITLASPAVGDVLTATGTTGVTVTAYDSGTGVLALSGTAALANYQFVLRTVKYNNTAAVSGATKTVTFVANDGIDNSATATSTITIAPLAIDLNGIAAGTGYNTFWSGVAVNSESATLATIVDANAGNLSSLTVTISGIHAGDVLTATATTGVTVSYDGPNHKLNLTGTASIANYQTVLRSVKYNNTSGGPGVGTISLAYQATDTAATVSNATGTVQILNAAGGVVARNIFYNNSKWDGNNASITTSDDGAIAIDKIAYLPGAGLSTTANVTSFTKGITGIMVDLGGTGTHGSITATDFIFKIGNNNTPSTTWVTAPAPSAVSVRAGAGVGGSDRVEIIWNNGTNDTTWAASSMFRTWLQVVTKANTNTGLAALGGTYPATYGDVFYFGNAPGDSFVTDASPNYAVDGADELEARNHAVGVISVPAAPAPTVTNIRDYNRDGIVDGTDSLYARNHPTVLLTPGALHLKFLSLAVGSPPNAPEGDGGDDAGVASALTAPSGGSTTSASPSWLASSLAAASVDGGSTAAALAQILAEDDSPDSSAQEDDALDALLAEMGL